MYSLDGVNIGFFLICRPILSQLRKKRVYKTSIPTELNIKNKLKFHYLKGT